MKQGSEQKNNTPSPKAALSGTVEITHNEHFGNVTAERAAAESAAAVALPKSDSSRSLNNDSPVMVSRPDTPADQVELAARAITPTLAEQPVSPKAPLVDPEVMSSSAPSSPSYARASAHLAAQPFADSEVSSLPTTPSHAASSSFAANIERERAATPPAVEVAKAPSFGERVKAALSCCIPKQR